MTFGETLTAARRARAFTQKQLSERSGITQAALSRYENDLRQPDTQTVTALAEAVGVTGWLLKDAGRVQNILGGNTHMRRRATASASIWRRLEAKCNLYRLHTRRVFEEISLNTELTFPQFDPFETTPTAAARMLRMQWRMPSGPVRNLMGWMEASGCVIFGESFGTPRLDALSQWADDHPVLMANTDSPTDRLRFFLAHELGHLCLHNIDLTDDIEGDANDFAAEFLMPANIIVSELHNLSLGKLHDLKRKWHTPMGSLIERAADLGRLSPTEHSKLTRRFRSLGWHKREPISGELPPENPELVAKIGRTLTARGLTNPEIAEIVGLANDAPHNPFIVSKPHLRAV